MLLTWWTEPDIGVPWGPLGEGPLGGIELVTGSDPIAEIRGLREALPKATKGNVLQQTLRAAVTVFAVAMFWLVAPAHAEELTPRPAVDAIFAAFDQRPLVGLGDAHGLAEEGEFYERLVRDPRFSARVGNVVFEAASATHQSMLDRYLNGDDVPATELRKVWFDTVGWASPPTVMCGKFLAAVREVNSALPPARRIKVWAGSPPADWTAIKSRDDFDRVTDQRDEHARQIVETQILSRGRKALLIYGGLHFAFLPSPPFPPEVGLRRGIERTRPGSIFVVHPYTGFFQPECSQQFESKTRWPQDSLVGPVKGTSLETLLLRPGCTVNVPPKPAPGAPPFPPEVAARIQAPFLRIFAGADADALLYLRPAHALNRSPDDPALTNDPALAAEIRRRLPLVGGSPAFMDNLAHQSRPYRAPSVATGAAPARLLR